MPKSIAAMVTPPAEGTCVRTLARTCEGRSRRISSFRRVGFASSEMAAARCFVKLNGVSPPKDRTMLPLDESTASRRPRASRPAPVPLVCRYQLDGAKTSYTSGAGCRRRGRAAAEYPTTERFFTAPSTRYTQRVSYIPPIHLRCNLASRFRNNPYR